MAQRELVHELLDTMPDTILSEVEAYLREVSVRELRAWLETVPIDDESVTAADLAAIARADEDMKNGRRVVRMADAEASLERFFQERLALADR